METILSILAADTFVMAMFGLGVILTSVMFYLILVLVAKMLADFLRRNH